MTSEPRPVVYVGLDQLWTVLPVVSCLMYNGIDWTDLMNNHAAQLVNSYRTKHYAAEAVI